MQETSSDGKVNRLAIEIDRIAGRRVAFTILEPDDYNRKYDDSKRVKTRQPSGLGTRQMHRRVGPRRRQAKAKSVLIDRFATRPIETLVPTTHWGLEMFHAYEAESRCGCGRSFDRRQGQGFWNG